MPEARPIVFTQPWFDARETERVAEALRGRTAGDGPFCRRVEGRLREQLGTAHVLLTASCTHALELSLLALGVGPGQDVVVPSFTFVSTANAVLRVGARPVFADIEEETLGLDPDDARERLTPKTTVLLPIHYAGTAAQMGPLAGLAGERGLLLVEDAAQGLGASFRGKPLGTLGDAGCFSFHETKNVVCGEGGAVAFRDPEVAQRAEIIREKGTNRNAFLRGEVDKYTWVAEGSSYVLSDVLAAILDAQLDKHAEILARRAATFARYTSGLADWAVQHGVRLPSEQPDRVSNHHIFHLLMATAADRDRALASLRAQGVPASFHYVPLHSSPFGSALGGSNTPLPVTERVAATLLRLPLHPLLSPADVARVIDATRKSLA